MKFVAAEGKHPLQNLDMIEHYSFPRELLRVGFLYNYWYGHMLHTEVIYIYIYIYIYKTLIPLMCTDPGGASSLNERRHVTAHLQVSRVFGDGRCALLRHEFSTRQTFTESWAETKRWVWLFTLPVFSAYLFCIINYTSLFFSFFRLWFLYIKIMCSHSSQPSMYPATDQKLRIFLSYKHVSLFYYCGIVPTRHLSFINTISPCAL